MAVGEVCIGKVGVGGGWGEEAREGRGTARGAINIKILLFLVIVYVLDLTCR